MEYRIEIASADNAERDDENLNSTRWESVASGRTLEELVNFLIRAANDEEFTIINSWLRLVKNDEEVTTY